MRMRHLRISALALKVMTPRFPKMNAADGAPLAGPMNPGNMPGNQFEFQQAQNVQQKSIEVYAQSLVQQQRMALNNHAIAQGMNSGVQGSPMTQQGLDGQHDLFAGNQPRPGMPAGAPGPPQGNHALQDYQMQLMLLEQQNKKRLLMARQEQDNISGPHAQGAVGAPGFPPSMSPQGSRAGPSPNPTDQMKKGTPRMGQQGLPGSPMPEGAMQQQRNSPVPNFDPNAMPPGMPPQYGFPGQMPQNPMMRPPSSHPGNFNAQQLTPQQIEAMRASGAMQNGAWRGPPPGMMPGQQQMGPMGNQPQQRGQMPPPPAPANEQPRAQEPSPSQPAQAPPTPSQANKPAPKKKPTKDNKVKWRASYFILSIVDVDCRSPQAKQKGQTQVLLQQRRLAKNRRRLRLPRRLRLCILIPSRMDSSSHRRPLRNLNHQQRRNSSSLLPWRITPTPVRHSAISMM